MLGECDEHPTFDKWCDPNVPFAQRWKLLNRPNGMPPRETFYFEKRHYGIVVACFHYLTVHLRCLFPKLWIQLGKSWSWEIIYGLHVMYLYWKGHWSRKDVLLGTLRLLRVVVQLHTPFTPAPPRDILRTELFGAGLGIKVSSEY